LGDTRFGRPQIRITYELASAFREGQPYFWEFPLTKAYDPRFSDFPKDEHGHNVFTDFRELSIPIFRPGEGQWDDPKNRERFESFIGMRNALRTDRDWVDFLYQLAGRYVKGGEIICPVTPLEEERDSEACRRGNGHPPRPLNGGTEVFRGDAKYLIPVPPCIISRVEVDGREFCVLDGATSRHRFAIRIWPGENEADAVAYAQGKSVEARESAKRTMIGAKILHVHDWKERLYDRMRKYRPAVDVTS
jgi:hypothetical protein